MKSSSTPQLLTGLAAGSLAWLLASRPAPRTGDVVIITGGSRGLGLAIARRFGQHGHRLVLAARNMDELEQARQALRKDGSVRSPHHIHLVAGDLTDPANAQKLVHEAVQTFGRIDVLINNAGIIEVGPFLNQPLDAFRRAMDTNFFASLQTIQAAVPHMLRQPERGGRRGSVINISSIGGKMPVPHLLPYVASKYALTGFSEGLHIELRQQGIRVTTVCPGLMRTGSHVAAQFTGQAEKEYRWFAFSATTPGLSTTTAHATRCIYNAFLAGTPEITITPQAWLGARVVGLAPSASQAIASLANDHLLPAPAPGGPAPLIPGKDLEKNPTPTHLEQSHNQA